MGEAGSQTATVAAAVSPKHLAIDPEVGLREPRCDSTSESFPNPGSTLADGGVDAKLVMDVVARMEDTEPFR
ncbi:unnamed protein product [Strongylus vulgaris]|uniref:Uncharacterized protein n=1 Tax=Strongylus vulgaris TaxID=40348 RepID=A0A3P7JNI5_STRVU|nr:unnamed protein product [Strongylus vulgaris]